MDRGVARSKSPIGEAILIFDEIFFVDRGHYVQFFKKTETGYSLDVLRDGELDGIYADSDDWHPLDGKRSLFPEWSRGFQ